MAIPHDVLERVRGTTQLVLLDLDGTTLTTDKHITPRTRQVLRAVSDTGLRVTFATGRMLGSAAHYAEQLGLPDPHVALNGSLVGQAPEEEPLFSGAIPRSLVLSSLEAVVDGVSLYWLTRSTVVTERRWPNHWRYLETWNGGVNEREVGSLLVEIREPVYQLHFVGPEAVLRELAPRFADPRLQTFVFPSARGPLFHLEVRRAEVDKGTGLEHLANHLGVPVEATLSVGDWLNDLELIQRAGVGVAMANASEVLKAEADYVLDGTNDEDGVADFLERLFL
jgi:Cof subfamily protein (haloacid dehalogenase superfamily)